MFEFFGSRDPQKALQRAREYLKENKTNAAIKILEDNLTEDEQAFDAYLELGRLYFEVEQRSRAIELLRDLQKIAPNRMDEIVALVSDLFYRKTSIDAGDLLIQTYVSNQQFDEIAKVLRAFNEREIKLLITRYEKIHQAALNKKVPNKRELESILTLASIHFFLQESAKALELIDFLLSHDSFIPQIMLWARATVRERYNDPFASLALLKVLFRQGMYEEGLSAAHRTLDKFPDFIDPLIEIITAAKPPRDQEETFAQLLTELHIKKGDLDASIQGLQHLLQKDPAKVDDVVKALRELEKVYPKELKILLALSDAYLQGGRVSLAISEFDRLLETAPDQYPVILKKYQQAFQKEPNNPQVIQGFVTLHLKQNNLAAAVEVIDQAYQNDPGLTEEYIQNLNAILERDISNHRALYLMALCLAQKGDKENVLVILENLSESGEEDLIEKATTQILKQKPTDPDYINLRARTLARRGKADQAYALLEPKLSGPLEEVIAYLSTLDEIANRQPSLGKKILAFYQRHRAAEPFAFELAEARLHAFCGEYEQAVKIFERWLGQAEQKETVKRAMIEVIQARPQAVPLLLAAARLFMKEGDVEIATRFFKTAQSVDPKAFFEIIDEFYDTLKNFPKDREVRVLLIDTFFNRKLWDRVIEEARKGIEVFGPEAQYFNLKLGQALVESGNLTDGVRPLMLSLEGGEDYSVEVVRYLDKILQIDKSNVPAHFARGRALAKARRIDEAVDEYLLTARILPARAEYVYEELKVLAAKALANPRILFALGNIEIILKKYEEGIRHLVQASELDTGFVKQVIPLFEKLIKQQPLPLLQFSLARVYHLAGVRASAVKYYIEAQQTDKSYREPAITEMKKICADDPRDIESRKGLAEIYFNFNNLEDALDLAGEIYRIDNHEGDWIKAFIPRILEKNPAHLPAYHLLLYYFLNEGEFKKAIEVGQRLIDISPTEAPRVIDELTPHLAHSPDIMFYVASLKITTGEIKPAVDLLEKMFYAAPSWSTEILKQLQRVIRLDSGNAEAFLLAARLFQHEKKYESALGALRKAEGLLPARREEIHLRAAQVHYEMGDSEKALEIYRDLLVTTKDRRAIYRLMKKTRADYQRHRLETLTGDHEDDRLSRAAVHLEAGRLDEAEREIAFRATTPEILRRQIILRARIFLQTRQPIQALEVMKNLPVDAETAPLYVLIYEMLGSYETAAAVLRQAGISGVEKQIESYQKRAQERRLAKGKIFIEGRM